MWSILENVPCALEKKGYSVTFEWNFFTHQLNLSGLMCHLMLVFPCNSLSVHWWCCSSVAHSCPALCSPRDCSTPGFPCPSPTPGACSNSCPLNWWRYSTISFSVIPFSCLQSFPASESFLRSQFFASGGQSIRVSASASVLPMNIQDWVPLEWTGWISLQSKGLSRVFSNTTVQVHWYKWLLKIPHYYCITVDFLFYGC